MTFRRMTTVGKTVGLLGAGLLALAGCSRSEPEQPAPDNMTLEATPSAEPTPAAPPSAEPTPEAPAITNTAAADVPPEAPVAPDAQMIDDADATGMTARVSRGEPTGGNEVAPQ